MNPSIDPSDPLFVAKLSTVSLEKLVKSKLQVWFDRQQSDRIELERVHKIVMEQVEKPLIELALQAHKGNQVKTAKMLGINRNTLKKKIDGYQIQLKNKVVMAAHSGNVLR